MNDNDNDWNWGGMGKRRRWQAWGGSMSRDLWLHLQDKSLHKLPVTVIIRLQ